MRLLDCERNVVGYAVLVMQCVRCYAHVWAVLCRVVPCVCACTSPILLDWTALLSQKVTCCCQRGAALLRWWRWSLVASSALNMARARDTPAARFTVFFTAFFNTAPPIALSETPTRRNDAFCPCIRDRITLSEMTGAASVASVDDPAALRGEMSCEFSCGLDARFVAGRGGSLATGTTPGGSTNSPPAPPLPDLPPAPPPPLSNLG